MKYCTCSLLMSSMFTLICCIIQNKTRPYYINGMKEELVQTNAIFHCLTCLCCDSHPFGALQSWPTRCNEPKQRYRDLKVESKWSRTAFFLLNAQLCITYNKAGCLPSVICPIVRDALFAIPPTSQGNRNMLHCLMLLSGVTVHRIIMV